MKTAKLITLVLFTAVSWAQRTAGPASITAVGEASVSASPDLARVDIGVVSQAANAQDATVQNASQAGTVIRACPVLPSPGGYGTPLPKRTNINVRFCLLGGNSGSMIGNAHPSQTSPAP
jgi:hypothetical protein